MSSPAGALMATVVGSLGTACSDVVVDSIVVERSRNAPQVQPGRSPGSCSEAPSEVTLPSWTLQVKGHVRWALVYLLK